MLKIAAYSFSFLVCVLLFARLSSRAVRLSVLLLLSYSLYLLWTPWFALVLASSTIFNYILGKVLRQRPSATYLWVGVVFNVGLLGTFKYLPDAAASLPIHAISTFARIALPLGISFWTFQAIGYLFDTYRGEDLDPSLPEFATFMVFFPVAISGPVCRLPEMLPQFRATALTSSHHLRTGFKRIAIGALMIQVAQVLGRGLVPGQGINSGFDRVTRWSGADVWCLAFGYGLQLFLDFAGYTHVAIGAATALGITVPENFALPFASTTPSEFWTRWHMSLSFWIRDYVFLPLAMFFRAVWWRNVLLVVSMVLFGVWHKGSVTLLLWGLYHGVLLVLHRQLQQISRKIGWSFAGPIWTVASWCTTTALVALGWILFRANSWREARTMYDAVFSIDQYSSHALDASVYELVLIVALGYAAIVSAAQLFRKYSQANELGVWLPCSGVVRAASDSVWLWAPPLYVLLFALVTFLTMTPDASVSSLMYSAF